MRMNPKKSYYNFIRKEKPTYKRRCKRIRASQKLFIPRGHNRKKRENKGWN